jgi:hypothetical protein
MFVSGNARIFVSGRAFDIIAAFRDVPVAHAGLQVQVLQRGDTLQQLKTPHGRTYRP